MPLPDFVPPMLARLGEAPFDSPDHLFEVKWDGIRALAFTEGGSYRAFTRNANDLVPRYPELGFLADLDEGYVLDGELVCLQEGKPDFHAVLRREQARNPMRIEALARSLPASYVVFDVLYAHGASVCDEPLVARRERLAELVEDTGNGRFVLSEGIVGAGKALFEECRSVGLEGVVAKRLTGRYRPGVRSDAWTKLKCTRETVCAILGYLAEGDEVRSVLVAVEEAGELVYAGRVGSGLSGSRGRELFTLFRSRGSDEPLIPAADRGRWLQPGFYCRVRYHERTENGLRAPVFLELLAPDG